MKKKKKKKKKKKRKRKENPSQYKSGEITRNLFQSDGIFFKKKNFRENNGKVKIGSVTVNKKDLIYDLTHLAVKPSSFNLNTNQHEAVLDELKKRDAC